MFTPKFISCLKKGYSAHDFFSDLRAGLSVGLISIPLALAFAIASGLTPEKGLFTAIVAGFLISFLGGSRVQIGGPTGAYVIVIYTIVQKYGYNGLALATLIAGCLLLILAIAKLGQWLKFIPYAVICGFTTGLALVLFSSQIKDFLGLNVSSLPAPFIERCKVLCSTLHTWNLAACVISVSSLIALFFLRSRFPKAPAAILVVIFASVIAFSLQLPIETIESKYGILPSTLPIPSLPKISWDNVVTVFPDAVTIAILGAIEALLSALVADNKIGKRHNSNAELFAQGMANIGSVLFGGLPATGAIARTQANIQLGAKTPFSGMIHALTILVLMLFLAPWVSKIPLPVLSAVLIYVAWNMSDLPHFISILRSSKAEAALLLTSFFLTVLIDLAVAVEVGVILSALMFLKKVNDKLVIKSRLEGEVYVCEYVGPLFYASSESLLSHSVPSEAKMIVLDLSKASLVDDAAHKAVETFKQKAKVPVTIKF